jgi:Phage major capsid protein E
MSMSSLDIFNGDAFSVVSLTDAINNIKYIPGRIGQLGIFNESSINTTVAMVEQQDGILKLISPSPRGGPGHTLPKGARSVLPILVPHFEINDSVMAEEVQNVRAFGSETALESLQSKIAERLAIASQSMEATHEYSRIGAVKGVVTYADGSTFSLFTTFGVSQIAEIDFDLDNATPASGVLRGQCAAVVRLIATELGGIPFSGVHAFCGDTFFDNLLAHPEVTKSYLNTPMAAVLREGYLLPDGNKIYGAFEFGGIVWENYRGSVDGTAFIDTNKCHIFPTGVPQLFKTYYAPADYEETVNTLGQRLYAKQFPMLNGKGRNLDTQMNALDICTRPRVLIKGKRT